MKKAKWLILIPWLIILIFQLNQDYKYISELNVMDIRNRIVGARLLSEGINPYTFKWNSEFDTKFYDELSYNNATVSRVTAPPSVLRIFQLFSDLHYSKGVKIWFWIQLLLLIIGLILILYEVKNWNQKLLICFIFLAFLVLFKGFHLHLTGGQNYLIFSFIWLLIYLGFKKNWHSWFIGLFITLFIYLKPTAIIAFVPLLIFNYRQIPYKSILTFSLLIFIVEIFSGEYIFWINYIEAMNIWAEYQIHGFPQSNIVLETAPKIIEGFIPPENPTILNVSWQNTSIQHWMNVLFNIKLTKYVLLTMFFFPVVIYTLSLKKKLQELSVLQLLFFGYVLNILIEYFLPAPKLSYNAVQLLLPLLLIIPLLINKTDQKYLVFFLIIIFCCLSELFSFIPFAMSIGEILILFLLLIYSNNFFHIFAQKFKQ